jgi:hypothetical protein
MFGIPWKKSLLQDFMFSARMGADESREVAIK